MPKTITLFGNGCGHIPSNPRYYEPPTHHKKRKPFLDKAAQRIADAYSNPLDYDIAHLFYHRDKVNKLGGYRKRRSESLEALTARVGRYILHHVNLATMSLGWYMEQSKSFYYVGYTKISEAVGVTISQLKRVMAIFIAAGYIKVTQRSRKPYKRGRDLKVPVIEVSPQLFVDLGFERGETMFHIERGQKELRKKVEKAEREQKPVKSLLFVPKTSPKKDTRANGTRGLAEIMASMAARFNTS